MNIVSALESHTATGAEKMEMLIAAVTPALAKLKTSGGLSGLTTSAENFAKEFAQSVFNYFRAVAAPALKAVADEAIAA
ncbi:MAG: hypothetical protein ACRYFW_11040 [Janthinobacterium lividum]